jgi:2',3'-cyclic-nucleotide 2'-phosphodiesterase
LPEPTSRILFIGDIIGQQGVELTLDLLPRIRRDFNIDFCIANGENLDKGKGLSEILAKKLLFGGVQVLTTGNHVWDGKDADRILDKSGPILRPHNYPDSMPGSGIFRIGLKNNLDILIINLQGLSYLQPLRCPFITSDEILSGHKDRKAIAIIDFHAESSAEKQALAWYLDGKISALIGTHTHVQTADERILPRGTGYITDAGMTGPFDSVIGMEREVAIKRFMEHRPHYYKMAEGNLRFNAVLLEISEREYKTVKIKRLNYSKAEYNGNKTD